jgi:hypothetical protein
MLITRVAISALPLISGPNVGEGLRRLVSRVHRVRLPMLAAVRGIGGPDIGERLRRVTPVTLAARLAIPCERRGRQRRGDEHAARRQDRG